MKKVVVTGGIASGKSTVCRFLKGDGVYQLDSDEVIHRLLLEDKPTVLQVVDVLGSGILSDGVIDRRKIAEIVFSDSQKLKALEEVLHPKLFRAILTKYRQLTALPGCKIFIVEMPLIQEIGKGRFFDVIISVLCDEALAKKRAVFSEEEYKRRMKYQWPTQKKAKYADYVIVNNGSIKELEKRVLDFIEAINNK